MSENNRPIKKYQLGMIECAVWAKQTADGKTYLQFSFQKNYKTKDGKYQNTSFFNKADLATIAMLSQRACLSEIQAQSVEAKAQEQVQAENTDDDVPF